MVETGGWVKCELDMRCRDIDMQARKELIEGSRYNDKYATLITRRSKYIDRSSIKKRKMITRILM